MTVRTRIKIVNSMDSMRWLCNSLADARVISWDIETEVIGAVKPFKRTNFQEWWGNDSLLVSIAFTWRVGQAAVIPLWHPQSKWRDPLAVLRHLRKYMNRGDCEYIGHNGKFDARWMDAKGCPVPQDFDTMLAAHMIDENRLKGLKPLAKDILGVVDYDIGEELKHASQVPLRKLAIYNGKDTDYTLRLRNQFKQLLRQDERTQRIYTQLMMPASNALVDIERVGVYIDPAKWENAHDIALDKRERVNAYIQKRVPEHLRPLNVQSPKQMGVFLFEHLGLPVIEQTKTGAPSTGAPTLKRLADKNKVAVAVLQYRKWAKYLNTYLLPWWYQHMNDNGRIHSNYNLAGTVTGRLSGNGGIQQVPRDGFIRNVIGAEPGWSLVVADFSQVELRIAAMVSNERRMLRQFANGEDIHTIRAQKMTQRQDITKEERFLAKAVNFGFIYGMGARKFRAYCFDEYELKLTERQAMRYRTGFFEDYPALRVWHDRQRRLAHRYGRVVSPLGRIRHLPDVHSEDDAKSSYAERQAINSPVSSFASDLMLIALVRLHKMFDPRHARLIATVHDSLMAEVKPKYVSKYCAMMKEVMEDMDYVKRHYGTDVTVPIVADVETGTHWGETEAWKG